MKQVPSLRQLVQKHFLSGVLVAIPFGVIIWLVGNTIELIWEMRNILPSDWQPSHFIEDERALFALNSLLIVGLTLSLVVVTSFVGWFSKQILGKKVLELLGEMVGRIPVIRGVYNALDQLLKTMASGSGQQFSRVVYIEYPRKGLWTLAFVTGPAKGNQVPPGTLNVYVPTTPNPTSGFYLLVPEVEVRESGLKVDEAFKTILSLGIVQ